MVGLGVRVAAGWCRQSRCRFLPAIGHPGDERRRGQPERTRSVQAPAALEAALTEPSAPTLFTAAEA